jgi:hypothetical protein
MFMPQAARSIAVTGMPRGRIAFEVFMTVSTKSLVTMHTLLAAAAARAGCH